jgi:hypothetical protein
MAKRPRMHEPISGYLKHPPPTPERWAQLFGFARHKEPEPLSPGAIEARERMAKALKDFEDRIDKENRDS